MDTARKRPAKMGKTWNVVLVLLIAVLITLLLLCAIYSSFIRIRKPDGVVMIHPFEFVDETPATPWRTAETVSLFGASYENGEGAITVMSADGDAVVAPGTSGSFLYHIRNGTTQAVDYTVEISLLIGGGGDDFPVPFKVRMSDENGTWLVGDADHMVDVAELNGICKRAYLTPNRYSILKLEWEWPFEGDDDYDTMLGNMISSMGMRSGDPVGMSVDMDMKVTASYAEEVLVTDGISPESYRLWLLPLIISLMAILLLIAVLWLYVHVMRAMRALATTAPEEIREAAPIVQLAQMLAEEPHVIPAVIPAVIRMAKTGHQAEVNVDTLCKHFEAGATVTMADMKRKRLISQKAKRVKILANGRMSKPLIVRADDFSEAAIKAITEVGGQAEFTP